MRQKLKIMFGLPITDVELIKKLPVRVLLKAYRIRVPETDKWYFETAYVPQDPSVIVYNQQKYVIPRIELKKILDSKENVVTDKKQAKQIRQQKAKNARSSRNK